MQKHLIDIRSKIAFTSDMPNDDQAQADATDTMTATDSQDAVESQIGTSRFDDYEAQVRAALGGEVSGQQGDEPASEDSIENEETEQEQEQESDDQDEQVAEDEEEAPAPKLADRFRFKDPADQAVAAIAKAKGVSLLEAAEIFKGQNPTERRETTEQVQDEAPALTVASVEARIEELEELDAQASSDLQFEEALQHRREANKLRNQLLDLKIEEREAKQRSQQEQISQFEAAYDKSARLATTYYPDTKKADSPLVKKMEEIDERMKRLGDPIYNSPDKPFQLAKLAAKQLGIPMTDPKAPAKKQSTTRPSLQPAGGNARTTTTDPAKKASEAIEGISSMRDYQDVVAALR